LSPVACTRPAVPGKARSSRTSRCPSRDNTAGAAPRAFARTSCREPVPRRRDIGGGDREPIPFKVHREHVEQVDIVVDEQNPGGGHSAPHLHGLDHSRCERSCLPQEAPFTQLCSDCLTVATGTRERRADREQRKARLLPPTVADRTGTKMSTTRPCCAVAINYGWDRVKKPQEGFMRTQRRTATRAQIASTSPKGHAPCRKP
jgi:hypothetical protein